MDGVRRFLVLCLLLAGCTAADDDAMAHWVEAALAGDLVSAREVMIDGLAFPLGESAASWIDGAEPFRSYGIDVDCHPEGGDTSCAATWRDRWIDGMSEVDTGAVVIKGRVEEGIVISISTVDFDPELRSSLNQHAAWLQANRTADYDERCLDDVFARECSELLVATVADWEASSR